MTTDNTTLTANGKKYEISRTAESGPNTKYAIIKCIHGRLRLHMTANYDPIVTDWHLNVSFSDATDAVKMPDLLGPQLSPFNPAEWMEMSAAQVVAMFLICKKLLNVSRA